ncbi:MAG: 1-aminocyclopropane-1-carboxylate deaminase/D-cysteine desulfhydrase [Bermanella sp.]
MDTFLSKLKQIHIQNITSLKVINDFEVSLHVKRDDLIDDVISGNKLFKLYYHLEVFFKNKHKTLITFGGAYSNHLHATAFAGQQLGIKTVGVIRAEPHELETLTPTLQDCKNWGMTLIGVSRSEYRLKQNSTMVQQHAQAFESPYWIPEGGAGELGVKGAELMLNGIDQTQYDVIVMACGTGTTLAGVIRASSPSVKVIGVPVLKGANWMHKEVEQYLESHMTNWELQLGYHFAGYAKWNDGLLNFIEQMQAQTNLPLDPVYTAKAFYGLLDLIKQEKIAKGSRVLFIHTGGLQGSRS